MVVMVVIGYFMRAPPQPAEPPPGVPGRGRTGEQAMPPRAVQPGQCRQRCLGRPWERNSHGFRRQQAGQGPACRSDRRWRDRRTGACPRASTPKDFLAAAKRNFVTLQDAWDRGDVASLRSMMTDEMLGEIKSQLAEREKTLGGVPNKTEVVMLDAQLLGIEDLGRRLHGQRGVLRDDPRGAVRRARALPRGVEHDKAQGGTAAGWWRESGLQ
jgi:hypothetical protein